jgi:hypothetical protein
MTQEITTQQIRALATQPALDPGILTGQLTPASFAKYRQDWGAYITWCEANGAAALVPVRLAQWRAHRVGETAHSPHTSNRQIAAQRIVREATASRYIPAAGTLPFAQIAGAKPGAGRARLKPGAHPQYPRRYAPALRYPRSAPHPGQTDRALLHTLTASRIRIFALADLPVDPVIQRDGGYFVQVRGKGQAEPCAAHRTRQAYNAIRTGLAARCARCICLPALPGAATGGAGRADHDGGSVAAGTRARAGRGPQSRHSA